MVVVGCDVGDEEVLLVEGCVVLEVVVDVVGDLDCVVC